MSACQHQMPSVAAAILSKHSQNKLNGVRKDHISQRKKIAAIEAMVKTVIVAKPVSRRPAQEIRPISCLTCLTTVLAMF